MRCTKAKKPFGEVELTLKNGTLFFIKWMRPVIKEAKHQN